MLACLIGVAATWVGVLLAYDSYYWGRSHQYLPVSFFIVTIVFVTYLLVRALTWTIARWSARRQSPRSAGSA